MDEDGGGEIDLDEFLLIMARDKANTDPLEEARKIFMMFDKDGGGTIDAGELGDALRQMGQKVTDEEVAKMIADVDDDGTGEIEFPEFCAMMGIDAAGEQAPKKEEKRPTIKREGTLHGVGLIVAKPTKKELKEQRDAEAERKRQEEERMQREADEEWSNALSKPLEDGTEAEVFSTGTFGYDYILHRAAKEGDEDKLVDIVEGRGANARDPNEVDDMGWTPLMWAASTSQPKVTEPPIRLSLVFWLLAQENALIENRLNRESCPPPLASPSHWLMFKQIAIRLLELGAETKPKDFDGRQAMHMAAMHGEDIIIKALCEKQATVNTK